MKNSSALDRTPLHDNADKFPEIVIRRRSGMNLNEEAY